MFIDLRKMESSSDKIKGALTQCRDLAKTGGHVMALYRLLRARFSWGRPRPIFLSHMVTNRCNATCPYCFWSHPKGEEMNLGEIERLYRSAKREGFVFNNIWGGEPLLRKDIVEVVRVSTRNKLLTTLVTNGQYLDEMHEVGRWTDVLVVSLDAPDSDHDSIRGVEGLFAKAISGIQRIRGQYPKVHLNICCVLSTLNRGRTEEMILLAKEMGASIYFCPVGDNQSIDEWPDQEGVGRFKKSKEEISEDFRIIKDYKKKGFLIESSFFLINHFLNGEGSYLCRRPRIYLNVYANGDMETCYLGTFANCRTMELSDILGLPEYNEAVGRSEKCQYGCNANDAIEISGLWRFHPSSLRNWI